jgi:hypothetical protein
MTRAKKAPQHNLAPGRDAHGKPVSLRTTREKDLDSGNSAASASRHGAVTRGAMGKEPRKRKRKTVP